MGQFQIFQKELIKQLPQIGKSHIIRDAGRGALPSGKRVSRTGKIYWETRQSRSDRIGGNI